ncbi:DUF3157 domain-containing protein [Flavivirga aquimarina]|uniref:DUF3157 domain-containing protein n=1 Tax=Flavivirga aquimarina TaxID=2027862 RepID=A0ABT8WEG3_9FLAO|nr:DUF3157 domain-containing protein [Flavivirga aquimarina]MDO5971552.1 DUF3157 domain-containing protein [Flavivirga aquimarina]
MKPYLIIFLLFISCACFAQDNFILNTDDGRRILLKSDYSWEYIDKKRPLIDSTEISLQKLKGNNSCNISKDFTEPKLDRKIQAQLKKGRATIKHIKKKVAKDYNCEVSEVLLLSAKEKKANGMYHFCANGKKVTYKRVGNSIIENNKFF